MKQCQIKVILDHNKTCDIIRQQNTGTEITDETKIVSI